MNKLLCMVLLSLIVAQINSMPTKSKKVKQVSQSKVILDKNDANVHGRQVKFPDI